MTSDGLFWRLVLVTRSVEEASLLWRLAVVRADEFAYRISHRVVSQHLGGIMDRKTLDRAATRLTATAVVSTRVLRKTYTEYRLDSTAFAQLTELTPPGQSDPLRIHTAVGQIDPTKSGSICGLQSATTAARLCMLLRSRDEALLLVWMHQVGAASAPVRVSSRDLESSLLGLVDRRTAMRSMARLQTAGLVTVTPMGRAGTEYRLDGAALHALVHQPFPFHEDAAASMPGWTSLTFPLLQRLNQALPAAATPAAQEAAMEA